MLISQKGVPRLSRITVERERLQRWLRAYSASPVRLLVGPAGSGKSTLLLRYMQQTETDAAYCRLPHACTPVELYAAVATALNSADIPTTYPGFLQLVCGSPARCLELAVDDADNATSAALDQLHALVEDLTPNVTLLYAARSREALRCRALVSRGVADLCDAQRLLFTAEEARSLAETRGLETSDLEVRRLIEDTDGWAVTVAHTIHRAAAEGQSIDRALSTWRADSQTFVSDFISAALESATPEDRDAFWMLYAGKTALDGHRLRQLEMRGLFVFDEGNGNLRLFRALRPAETRFTPESVSFVPPMMVRMFRSFEASIERREIHWVRRRDHEIVKYLLLKRDGSATREEIAATFWPNADRHLATQSVRTAISKIRKAIAEAVGSGCVDRYFRTTPDLHVDLDNVVCDVRRFAAHFSDGEAALNAGDPNGAEMNLRACYKLYRGRLLEFDGEREWFAGSAATMQERYLLALEWLGELALERGDTTAAQLYIFHARSQAPERVGVTRLMERLSLAQCAVAAQLGSVPQIESGTALQGLQPA